MAAVLPLLPLTTTIDDGLSAYLPVLLAASPCFDVFCLDEGDEDMDDEGDDELLSLLQFESRHRLPGCGGLPPASGFTFSRPGVWLR